ncbi:MAG TPA: efflux transporter outer membrane subunit [Acidobacteriaceae bacterium]|jgi:multidrug efflux system outer membrane protein
MRKQSIAAALGAATLLLSGCTVGPKYQRPTIDTPTVYRDTEANGNTQTSKQPHDPNGVPLPGQSNPTPSTALSIGDEKWWEVFGDPQLQDLIRTALKQNYDVRIAAERVLESQAQLGITRSQQFPQINGQGGYTAQRYPSAQFGGLGSFVTHLGQLGLSSSWNLDFWGQYRNATKAARAQLLASQWAQRGVMDTLILDVATGYFQLRTLDLELEISKRTLASRQESLQLTQTLEAGGNTSLLDVRQAEELVSAAAANIPDTERQITQEENALQTLLGQNPGPIPRGLPIDQQPRMPVVPAGLPSTLIERRPDIRQAEEQLIAANAQIGVAKAEYFPAISLTGQVGTASNALNTLFQDSTFAYSYGAAITQPIFNAGRIRSNVHLTEAQEREAVLTYKKTIAQSFQDVSNALIAYQKFREFREQSERFVTASRDALNLSNMRYKGGYSAYLDVLTNQTTLFQGQLTLASAREEEMLSLVQLYNALGGGWQQ